MTYRQRISLFFIIDSLIVLSCIFYSRFLVDATFSVFTTSTVIISISLLLSHHLFAYTLKLYKKSWEYASVGELVSIFKAITLSIITAAIAQQLINQEIFYRLMMVTWMLHLILIGGSRFCWRIFRGTYIKKNDKRKRTLIIGAGSAGTMVARQLKHNQDSELYTVGFIDDNPNKHNLDILGIPVLGGIDMIEQIVKEKNIMNIIIAIPSLSKRKLNIIFQECAKTKAKTQILPMLEDLITGKVSVNQFRDVQVEDLLGRDPVELDIESISEYITNKVVLVTGAGGSIGSEICRQIANFNPKQLVLLGHGENSIYVIELELSEAFQSSNIEIITVIADVQDKQKMMAVMGTYRPNVVYHAAAHKHVPLMERNPEEAIKNNIIGTKNVAEAASWYNVNTFVMVSTDKAVNPTSVMGASKKLTEMIVQEMDKHSDTKFVAVRFGNVLGSRGSVIPLFKGQIEKGGPVTVTHPDMVRYFMTIPEASRLVIQAGALAKGGEIFVLDMGEPVKIIDLAHNLIRLSGYSIEEIGVKFSGIRPGEKLYEELLKENEVHEQQVYPNIYVGKTTELYIQEIEKIILTYPNMTKQELRDELLLIANRSSSPQSVMTSTG
ncbi:polysaccharide biosynthesis protein [Ferdinandcohnia sp. Marseille-Q9671]